MKIFSALQFQKDIHMYHFMSVLTIPQQGSKSTQSKHKMYWLSMASVILILQKMILRLMKISQTTELTGEEDLGLEAECAGPGLTLLLLCQFPTSCSDPCSVSLWTVFLDFCIHSNRKALLSKSSTVICKLEYHYCFISESADQNLNPSSGP